jgi:hypothetical protein
MFEVELYSRPPPRLFKVSTTSKMALLFVYKYPLRLYLLFSSVSCVAVRRKACGLYIWREWGEDCVTNNFVILVREFLTVTVVKLSTYR